MKRARNYIPKPQNSLLKWYVEDPSKACLGKIKAF